MNPIARFHEDRRRARAERDPCAELCALATVGADGAPAVRTLVLRDLEGPAHPSEGTRLAVFINDSSPKWPVMTKVSAVTYFPSLKLQYRFSCVTAPVAAELVHSRWKDRPEAPKRMDWYYTERPQSSPVASRNQLVEELGNLTLPEPLIAPPSARGLYLLPFEMERLDLDQPEGIHDRRRWHRPAPSSPRIGDAPTPKTLSAADWTEATLVP